MRLSVVPFVVAISTTLAVSAALKTLVFPSETSTSYVELVPQKPLNLQAFTLCMRVATELSGEREFILFAYRIAQHDELNVWRELDGRFALFLNGEAVYFSLPQLGPLQTHLCVTWNSNSGATAFFMDGKKSLTKIFKKGNRVSAEGKVLLGQDPDSYLGDFDAKQSFVGELYDVNMWDSVLPDTTIQDMSSGIKVPKGNVFDWETTQIQVYGEVEVVNS